MIERMRMGIGTKIRVTKLRTTSMTRKKTTMVTRDETAQTMAYSEIKRI